MLVPVVARFISADAFCSSWYETWTMELNDVDFRDNMKIKIQRFPARGIIDASSCNGVVFPSWRTDHSPYSNPVTLLVYRIRFHQSELPTTRYNVVWTASRVQIAENFQALQAAFGRVVLIMSVVGPEKRNLFSIRHCSARLCVYTEPKISNVTCAGTD